MLSVEDISVSFITAEGKKKSSNTYKFGKKALDAMHVAGKQSVEVSTQASIELATLPRCFRQAPFPAALQTCSCPVLDASPCFGDIPAMSSGTIVPYAYPVVLLLA